MQVHNSDNAYPFAKKKTIRALDPISFPSALSAIVYVHHLYITYVMAYIMQTTLYHKALKAFIYNLQSVRIAYRLSHSTGLRGHQFRFRTVERAPETRAVCIRRKEAKTMTK